MGCWCVAVAAHCCGRWPLPSGSVLRARCAWHWPRLVGRAVLATLRYRVRRTRSSLRVCVLLAVPILLGLARAAHMMVILAYAGLIFPFWSMPPAR